MTTQRTQGNLIASRQWNARTLFYVAQVPGDMGADWGYTTERAKALPLNRHFAKLFAADCRAVGSVARLTEARQENHAADRSHLCRGVAGSIPAASA